MVKWKKFLAVLLLISSFFLMGLSSAPISGQKNLKTFEIETTIQIDLVFMGIAPDFIDISLLDQTLTSLIQGLSYKRSGILLDLSNVGKLSSIKIEYNYVFASESFTSNFKSKLLSAGQQDTIANKTGLFIDQQIVSEWLDQNLPITPPTNGYSLLLANFSDLGQHWYKKGYYDIDTERNITRNFKNSFSGQSPESRYFFIDLSVTDSYLATLGSDGPIQNLVKKYADNKLKIAYYFRDWVFEVISDLFLSDLIYSTPNFKQTFSDKLADIEASPPNSKQIFDIYLINNITNKSVNDLQSFINPQMILNSYKDLLPWYDWQIKVNYVEASDYSSLSNAIKLATDTGDNKTGIDLLTLYDYLFNEILTGDYINDLPFISTDKNNYLVFSFAFDEGVLGISYKDKFQGEILGASLFGLIPELNFLELSGRYIPLIISSLDYKLMFTPDQYNRTYGFTQLIIHELGHAVGLTHPHGRSWSASMIDDPMSYISYSYFFSRFKKDQVRRGEVDLAVHYTNIYLTAIDDSSVNSKLYSQLKNKFDQLMSFYNEMDYMNAYTRAWELFSSAKNLYSVYRTQTTRSTVSSKSTTSTATFSWVLPGLLLVLIVSLSRIKKKPN